MPAGALLLDAAPPLLRSCPWTLSLDNSQKFHSPSISPSQIAQTSRQIRQKSFHRSLDPLPRRRHSASVISFDAFPVSRYSGPLHVLRAGLHRPPVSAVPAVPSAQRDGTSRSTSKLGLGDTETPKNQNPKPASAEPLTSLTSLGTPPEPVSPRLSTLSTATYFFVTASGPWTVAPPILAPDLDSCSTTTPAPAHRSDRRFDPPRFL